MTIAIIGLGRIGSPLAHELFLGGKPVVLANRDQSKAMTLATRLIGRRDGVRADNPDTDHGTFVRAKDFRSNPYNCNAAAAN